MSRPTFDPFGRVLAEAGTYADRLQHLGVDADESETVEMILDTVRTWARQEIDSFAIDHESKLPPKVLHTAGKLGFYGLSIPESHGGAGMSMTACARVVDELATFDRSVATSIGLHNGLGLQGLIKYGSAALKDRWLPRLASGDIAAFAATEPDAGSHIAGLRTTGVQSGDGPLLVSGEKAWVTNGGLASVYTVVARTPGLGGARRGTSLLLVDRNTHGLQVGKEEHKLGIKGSSTTPLYFDNAVVPLDCVIGEPGKGLELMAQVLSWGRTIMAGGCLGTARAAYRMAVAHAMNRRQFGRAIASFGLVREKIAGMRASIYATESVIRLVTQLQDHGHDIVWESSIAKVLGSEVAGHVVDDSLQIHGGTGYMEETGVARLMRDCRITRIFEGANDVLRCHIAASAFEGRPDGEAPRLSGRVDARLDREAEVFDALGAAADEATRKVRERFGIRVIEHQLHQKGIAEAMIARFAMLATILRTDGALRRAADAGAVDRELALTRHAVAMLSRMGHEGVAITARDEEEALVERLSDWEYAQL